MIAASARTDAWRKRCAAVFGGARAAIGLAGMAAAVALALATTPARANVEEFSTFAVFPQQQDDESLLDHLLTRLPRAWDEQWRHSNGGFRTSQGCLTSGNWFIDTDFKARAPMGNRAWFGVGLFQSESDILGVENLDLSFHFPQPRGTAFAMFRPSAEKAAQDFALGWETGADTSAVHFRATWTLEDIFNNFWAFRQTQVGGLSEPYEKRPYEPALMLAVRQPDWTLEASGKWLTPSRKRVGDVNSQQDILRRELWGAAGGMRAERRVGRFWLEARGEQRQAAGHDTPIAMGVVETDSYRRQWSAEGAVRTTWESRATTAEARYVYQASNERSGPVATPSHLRTDARLVNLDVAKSFGDRVTARVGGLYSRITVDQANAPVFVYPTRNESRAYLGLALRYGRVWVAGVEGIELDPENYEVWLVHDKGFLQLQMTF